MQTNRRTFLTLAGAAPLVLLASGSRAAEIAPATCHDPAALPFSQKSRRRSLGYVEVSTEPGKACGGCAFFTATQPGCGTCQLLTGGPVNAGAVCTSFAARAG